MEHPEKRDLDLTRKQLCAWLAGKLPSAGDVRIHGMSAPAEAGASNETLLFDAEWDSAGEVHHEHLVIRLKPRGMTLFPTYDLALQFRIMQVLDGTNVPVPRMRWLEMDDGPLGVPFYVMDRMNGRVPSDSPPMHLAGWITELSPEQRGRLWWNGIETMTRVHRLDWRALGFDFLAEPQRGATPLEQQLHCYDEYLNWAIDPSGYPMLQTAQRWLHAHQPEDEPVALCWGDSRLANQIFDDQLNCVALLDWELARLGDPVQDLAWWLTLDRCFSEGLGIPQLPGFPDRAATIARWEQLLGRQARHLGYYEVLGLYRYSIMMARLTVTYKHYGIYPFDDDLFMYNIGGTTLTRVFEEVSGVRAGTPPRPRACG
jgi:aminoglycoside phosphotransferase (APT) family kinase protein